MKPNEIYCFSVLSEDEHIWWHTDGNTNLVTVKTKENTFVSVPIYNVFYSCSTKEIALELVENSKDIIFGNEYYFKHGVRTYYFKMRKFKQSPTGYPYNETEENYNRYLSFIRKLFQNKQLYKEYSSLRKIDEKNEGNEKQMNLFE